MSHYGQMSDHAPRRRRRKPQATRPGRQEAFWESVLGACLLVLAILVWSILAMLLSV